MKILFSIQDLSEAILKGDGKRAVEVSRYLLDEGLPVEDLIHYGLSSALHSLDVKCTMEEFNLLEIMLAGRAVMRVMDEVVVRHMEGRIEPDGRGRVVILGTIQGDIHELGKHIVRTILMAHGFRVIDLGKDVPPQNFVATALSEGAEVIGISSLITLTYPEVRKVRSLLHGRGGKGIKVVAGGAALQQATPGDLNVDFVARDVFHALHYIKGGEG